MTVIYNINNTFSTNYKFSHFNTTNINIIIINWCHNWKHYPIKLGQNPLIWFIENSACAITIHFNSFYKF